MAVDTDTVDTVDTTVDTVDTTVASAPLMLSPRLMLMPTTDTTVIPTVDTMVVTTAILTDTVTTVASAPLRPNPKLITAMDTAVPMDTTVDTEATTAVDTTGDKMFIQDQVTRKLSNLANFDNEIFLFSLPPTSLQHFNVLVSVES